MHEVVDHVDISTGRRDQRRIAQIALDNFHPGDPGNVAQFFGGAHENAHLETGIEQPWH